MDNDLISVIIPAYNAEATITRCINSIQRQTYSNLEIIVVNDGSEDNTEKIVDAIHALDSRVKLISIPNGGVSHARNIGIDNSTGDYITFVDADDYIDHDMYECLIGIIKKYNVKIAHCSYKNVDENENILSAVGDTGKIIQQSHDEAISCILNGNIFAGGLCNKLFDSKLFYDIRLDENIKFNEDVLANYCLFDKVDTSVYVDRALYNYVACESSSTHSANSLVSAEQSLFVAKKMLKLSKGKTYEYDSQNRVAKNLLVFYRADIFACNKTLKSEKKNVM